MDQAIELLLCKSKGLNLKLSLTKIKELEREHCTKSLPSTLPNPYLSAPHLR
jgi:hypothetical protein